MIRATRLGILADVHGEHRLLQRALDHLRRLRVERIVLLGDLFDRVDQAELCASLLSDWNIIGVYGNHELDALRHRQENELQLGPYTDAVLETLELELVIDDALFIHEAPVSHAPDPLHSVLGRANGHVHPTGARITFSGHTHHRSARDDRGPLDISGGRLQLRSERRYLINPGATADGLFAVWDRWRSVVIFEQVW
jgi:predicted phosphodiesterase